MQPGRQSKDYVPSLDGMRAISILLVMLSHYGFDVMPGAFGVTIFFFISGYLISGLLFAELQGSGTIALGAFYMRRALRLYPALLVMVLISAIVFPLLGTHVSIGDVFAALLYFANYWVWFGGFDSGSAQAIHPYSMLWSLAVEEHYYLVFPMLCLLFGKRTRRFAGLILMLILAVTVWRFHVAGGCTANACPSRWVEHATDTRVDSILYGALLATLLASPLRERTLRVMDGLPAFSVGIALLIGALAVRDPWFRDTTRYTVQGIGLFFAVGSVLYAARLEPARALLSTVPFVRIGRWSYSLYLWHWVVRAVASAVLPASMWTPIADPHAVPPFWWLLRVFAPMTVAAFVLAASSYYFVERPMVRLRRRFGSHAVADSGVGEKPRAEQAIVL